MIVSKSSEHEFSKYQNGYLVFSFIYLPVLYHLTPSVVWAYSDTCIIVIQKNKFKLIKSSDREIGNQGFFNQKKESLYPFSYSFHQLILTYTRTSLVVAESFSDHLLSTTNVKREN